MRKLILISSLFLLCSCSHIVQDSKDVASQTAEDAKTAQEKVSVGVVRVASDVRDNVKLTGEHLRNWLLTPLPSKEKLPMPTRYCYRVLQDILCYREQMPNWENKLVGYQGKDAAAPTPATTQPLPLRNNVAAADPAAHIASSKPVFAEIPKDAKEAKNTNTETATIDGAHETLPDSPLAPQL